MADHGYVQLFVHRCEVCALSRNDDLCPLCAHSSTWLSPCINGTDFATRHHVSISLSFFLKIFKSGGLYFSQRGNSNHFSTFHPSQMVAANSPEMPREMDPISKKTHQIWWLWKHNCDRLDGFIGQSRTTSHDDATLISSSHDFPQAVATAFLKWGDRS